MLHLALLACVRSAPPGEDPAGGDTGTDPAWVVAWGDLHAHTNFSADACEDPESCVPDAPTPGEAFFERAALNGLRFAAMTDHAEFVTWTRTSDGLSLDIWSATQALLAAAEGGPVVPILGYEWTAGEDPEDATRHGHRTVLLEDPAACAAYRVGGGVYEDRKAWLGFEDYAPNDATWVNEAGALEERLAAAGGEPGCVPTRVVQFVHHPALDPPASLDWSEPYGTVAGDRLVEIYSEHGTSECADPAGDGCDFHLHAEHYAPEGSAQAALQLGWKLGFVAGTDSHDADPGSIANGTSHSAFFYDADGDGRADDPQSQWGPGGLTGVIVEDGALDRGAIFDALQARHTLASSWPFAGLTVRARGADGSTWLPGDDVPAAASPLTVEVTVDDPEVTGWLVELVDPWNGIEAGPELVLGAGEIRYPRLRVDRGGTEERVWASPFFGI